MNPAGRLQSLPQHFLGGRLADGASHRDDACRSSLARRNGKFAECGKHVLDHDHGHGEPAESRQLGFGNDQETGPIGNGETGVIMAVDPITLDGEKGFARLDGPAVDGNAGDSGRQAANGASCRDGDHVGDCP